MTMDNELVSVEVDPATGTFALDGVPGQNLISHEPDAGDTYNFSPPNGAPGTAAPGTAVTDPTSVEVELVEQGPLRAIIRVRRRYRWAEGLEPDAHRPPDTQQQDVPFGQVDTEVVSDLELRAGEAAVRITTSFDNHSRDHRVRAHFPLASRVDSTEAECAFATVSRTPNPEGGPHEKPLATYPSRRFVTAGELTVTHQGLLEHELVEGGGALAITLLRATGVIARPAPAYRPVIAGPPVPLRDAQMPGPQTFRYALARHCADRWALADSIWTPLLTTRAVGGGELEDRGSRLPIGGNAQISALYRREGAIEVRAFNPSDRPATLELPGRSGVLVDLRGRPQQPWADQIPLPPWSILTARVDD